ALIHRGDAGQDEDYDVAMTLRLMISVVLFVAALFLATPWSTIFHEPSLAGPIQVLAIVFLLSPWALVPNTKLTVKLSYRSLVIPSVLNQVVNSMGAIALALLGFGFWALIIAWIVSQAVWVVALSIVHPWRPRLRFDPRVVRSLFGYSRHIIVASILTFLMTNVDNFSVGYLLGSSALGYYAVAYSLCLLSSMVSGSA